MLNILSRRRRDEAAAAGTVDLLAGAAPRGSEDEETLRIVRDMQPAIHVGEEDRRHELMLLMRAVDIAGIPRTSPIPTRADTAPGEPALHTALVQLGGYNVTLVDVERIDEERARVSSGPVSAAIVERLYALRRRDGTGDQHA